MFGYGTGTSTRIVRIDQSVRYEHLYPCSTNTSNTGSVQRSPKCSRIARDRVREYSHISRSFTDICLTTVAPFREHANLVRELIAKFANSPPVPYRTHTVALRIIVYEYGTVPYHIIIRRLQYRTVRVSAVVYDQTTVR